MASEWMTGTNDWLTSANDIQMDDRDKRLAPANGIRMDDRDKWMIMALERMTRINDKLALADGIRGGWPGWMNS